jgi:hypothetical protein
VTSSVVREFWSVCHRRTESNGEPFTCEKILATSRWVWGLGDGRGEEEGVQRGAVESFAGVRAGRDGDGEQRRPARLWLEPGGDQVLVNESDAAGRGRAGISGVAVPARWRRSMGAGRPPGVVPGSIGRRGQALGYRGFAGRG